MLAEDNPINQTVTSRMLLRLGYQVETVPNGVEAVRAALDGCYSAVLMDCQMPDMDGFEATHHIRERETGMRRIPIIALTANALEGDRRRCLDAGMDDYLSKPFDLHQLDRVLTRWTQSRHAETIQ